MKIVPMQDDSFDTLVTQTLRTVAKRSQRVYRQTYDRWADWCHNNGNDFLNINAGTVSEFLLSQPVTKSTRNRQLSTMRKLAKVLATLDYNNPAREAAYKSLMLIVAPDTEEGSERDKVALTPDQIQRVLNTWPGDDPLSARNRALIYTLLYTGIRRTEAAALRWTDVDLDAGVIHIRHGKGDKMRDVAILSDDAIDVLRHWLNILSGRSVYVFPRITSGCAIADAPIDGDAVYYVIDHTAKLSGVKFSPHDLRRTLATNGLAEQTPIPEMQAQLGHVNSATTLRYAQPSDAQRRRKTIKLGY